MVHQIAEKPNFDNAEDLMMTIETKTIEFADNVLSILYEE